VTSVTLGANFFVRGQQRCTTEVTEITETACKGTSALLCDLCDLCGETSHGLRSAPRWVYSLLGRRSHGGYSPETCDDWVERPKTSESRSAEPA
jgi:hypothetical protein